MQAEEVVLLSSDDTTPHSSLSVEAMTDMEDETKIEKKNHTTDPSVNYDEQLNDIMNDLFYIHHDHEITGPFEAKDILKLYITSKIKDEIWIKSAQDLKDQKTAKWHKFKLIANDGENAELKKKYPKFCNYLMSMIKSKNMQQIEAPSYGEESEEMLIAWKLQLKQQKETSLAKKLMQVAGYILMLLVALVVGVHILPFACLFSFCIYLPMTRWCTDDDEAKQLTAVLSGLGLIIVPFMIVYIVLLGGVDLDYWNGEIQSWMIGYIAWGICSFLLMLPLPLYFVLGDDRDAPKMLDRYFAAEFWLLGISFNSISVRALMRTSSHTRFMLIFIFPPIAALLPSFIIGFIANFALEEKFILKCSDDYADSGSNLCYNDGSGCCEVISSHDISNTYTFLGGLASNILATWAIIRICGYLLVHASNKASVFAKREK